MEQTRACFVRANRVWLANEFDVLSVLLAQVSLVAVDQICVIHEAKNGCKKSIDSLKACFENENNMVTQLLYLPPANVSGFTKSLASLMSIFMSI